MRKTASCSGPILAATLAVIASTTRARAGADDGKALYEQKCKICHSVADDRGKMADKGGPLDKVGAKHDAKWLQEYLQDPKSKMPDAKMPKVKLSDTELGDLIAFLQTLK